MSDKEKQMLVDEVNIVRGLHHPNIVRYYDMIIGHVVSRTNMCLCKCTSFLKPASESEFFKLNRLDHCPVEHQDLWGIYYRVLGMGVEHMHLSPYGDKNNAQMLLAEYQQDEIL